MTQPTHDQSPAFPATRWTLVVRVQTGDEKDAARAMEEICGQYWYPIYAFARRSGLGSHDAEDLTQVFFQRLIASDTIQAARREKGRLRTFMLSLLKRVISNYVRGISAEKRGGSAAATISLDDEDAEERYAHEPANAADPESIFDRAWAGGVLTAAEKRLHEDFAKADNLDCYERLREFLPLGENATPYHAVAATLGIAEGTLRLQIHRMRKRYAALIEDEIARTVNGPGEVKAELDYLMTVVGR